MSLPKGTNINASDVKTSQPEPCFKRVCTTPKLTPKFVNCPSVPNRPLLFSFPYLLFILPGHAETDLIKSSSHRFLISRSSPPSCKYPFFTLCPL
jgi:hypothetical protein